MIIAKNRNLRSKKPSDFEKDKPKLRLLKATHSIAVSFFLKIPSHFTPQSAALITPLLRVLAPSLHALSQIDGKKIIGLITKWQCISLTVFKDMGSTKRKLVQLCMAVLCVALPQKGFSALDRVWLTDCAYGEGACRDVFNQVYVGFEGGWGTGLFKSNRSIHNGPAATLTSTVDFGLDILPGYHVGGNVGYVFNRCWRTDISYTYLHNVVQWQTAFLGTSTHSFDATHHTHLILWNAYLHLTDYLNGCLGFSPYLTGGVGVAINVLNTIKERDFSTTLLARDNGSRHKNFGARFGMGVLKPFCDQLALDMGFNVNFIGNIRSGRRQNLTTGGSVPITSFRHSNNWITTFYVGLKYRI